MTPPRGLTEAEIYDIVRTVLGEEGTPLDNVDSAFVFTETDLVVDIDQVATLIARRLVAE